MKKNLLPAVVITAGIFAAATVSIFAGYYISGTLGMGHALIGASTSNLKQSGTITADRYLVNTGDSVAVTLKDGGHPGDFVGRAKEHNRTANYTYAGIYRYLICADGREYMSDKANLSFNEPGDYKVEGYITFMWQTTGNKVAAGFARYYYSTVQVTCIIRVSDMDDLEDLKEPEQPLAPDQSTEEKEKPKPVLAGTVSHTTHWEENRKEFNDRCKRQAETGWIHDENTFFSGEKFVLSADAKGEELPSAVHVEIEGTNYATVLYQDRGGYSGSLFAPEMIHLWGRNKAETLTFVFSAYIDGILLTDRQNVVIDDRKFYWLMHRKE